MFIFFRCRYHMSLSAPWIAWTFYYQFDVSLSLGILKYTVLSHLKKRAGKMAHGGYTNRHGFRGGSSICGTRGAPVNFKDISNFKNITVGQFQRFFANKGLGACWFFFVEPRQSSLLRANRVGLQCECKYRI
jgi:hypothetical protein